MVVSKAKALSCIWELFVEIPRLDSPSCFEYLSDHTRWKARNKVQEGEEEQGKNVEDGLIAV